jgi:hypothetical protein
MIEELESPVIGGQQETQQRKDPDDARRRVTRPGGSLERRRLVGGAVGVYGPRRGRETTPAGIDIVNEGELTKGGNWVAFINSRLSGFEPGQDGTTFALLGDSDDWKEFSDFYEKALEGGTLF